MEERKNSTPSSSMSRGPKGPGGRMRGPMPKVKNPGKLLLRILKYVMKYYGISVIIVALCIFIGVIANVQGTMLSLIHI